ncbi:hypothetical protein LQZ19_11345 [Treponema primitia]|uniref:hypothetical protein n=1 Tax=Treponema primitia TaxID=88058 RepID=UPI003980BAA2
MNKENILEFDRENIVGGLNRRILEFLLNKIIKILPEEKRKQIRENAYCDSKNNEKIMIQKYLNIANINKNIFSERLSFKGAIIHIDNTMGNSILEKSLNLIVLRYYRPYKEILNLFKMNEMNSFYEKIIKMNNIRNLISHDSDKSMSKDDYNYYITNIYFIANILLRTLEEAE